MFKLHWELISGSRRESVAVLLPLTCTVSHALTEVAQVLNRETVRLHRLTLEELGVVDNEYAVKATLLRYERDGLA